MNQTATEVHKRELFGHPIGLYVLFMTEMWERFSYYGMRALLTLYLVQKTTGDNPGQGWSPTEAIMLYGWYTMLVYVLAIPGGMLADKVFGQKKAVLYGAIILVAGHTVLAIDDMLFFYIGLGLIVTGVGLLKPNISTMVGGLYKEGDIRRDKGFSIFYVGINLGALLSTFIVGYIGEQIGWHYGFGLAGIAMLFGLVVYLMGQKYLIHVGNKPTAEQKADDVSVMSLFGDLFKSPLHLIIVLILVSYGVYAGLTYESIDKWGYGAVFIFIALVVGMMMMIYKNLENKKQKDRYLVLLISFFLVVVFWGAFEQAGGLMSIYAKNKTDRMLLGFEVPATWFQGVNSLYIVILATFVATLWARRELKGKEASSLFKMAVGTIIMGLGFVFMIFASMEFEAKGSSAMYWLLGAYLLHTIGELSSSPVALSFITKLAPVKYASLLMGVYFAATGFGNKLAGVLGENAEHLGEKTIFIGITIFTVIFGLLVIAILKPLKRLTHGAEDDEK